MTSIKVASHSAILKLALELLLPQRHAAVDTTALPPLRKPSDTFLLAKHIACTSHPFFSKGSNMNNKIYVGNLAYAVRDADLEQLFSEFGDIISAKVMMERDTGRSKGFGFVEMGTDAQAQAAIEALHETSWNGRNMIANIARPREERPAGFGGRNRY